MRNESEGVTGAAQCGCVSRLSGGFQEKEKQARGDALQDMAGRINRYIDLVCILYWVTHCTYSYFLRAVELRNKGVGSVYSG